MVVIDNTLCHGIHFCPAKGVCIEACALNAISIVNVVKGVVDVNDTCTDCGVCVMNCPLEAIHLLE